MMSADIIQEFVTSSNTNAKPYKSAAPDFVGFMHLTK